MSNQQYRASVRDEVIREGFAIRPVRFAEQVGETHPEFCRVRVSYIAEYIMRPSDRPDLDPFTYEFDESTQEWRCKGSPYRPAAMGDQPHWVRRFRFVYEPEGADFFGPRASANKADQWEVEGPHNEILLFAYVDFFLYLRDVWQDLHHVLTAD